MAEYVGNIDGKSNGATLHLPVANSVTVNNGDFVYFASGRITNASVAGARLIGLCTETATGDSDGTVTASVIVDPQAKYLVDNDNVGTTFAASHVGSYFDLTGSGGSQLVDTSTTGTSGQLLCVEYNPQMNNKEDDTSYGLFVIAEHATKL